MEQPARYMFDDGVVRIGRGIICCHDTTYFIYAINSTRIGGNGKRFVRYSWFIIAILTSYIGISQNDFFGGAICLAVGIAMCFYVKEKYTLFLNTVAGERRLLWSMKKKYLEDIRRCIEQCRVVAKQTLPLPLPQKVTVKTPVLADNILDNSFRATPKIDPRRTRVASVLFPMREGNSVPVSPMTIVIEALPTKQGLLWFVDKVALLFDFALFAGMFAFVAGAEVERQTGRNILSDLGGYLSTARTGLAIDNKAREPADVARER